MIKKFKRASYAAALACAIGLVCTLFIQPSAHLVDESVSALTKPVQWFSYFAYVGAFWMYAMAKGRSGFVGLILSCFSIIGMVVISKMADLSAGPVDKACPKCSGKNELDAQACRYCATPLA